MKLRRFKTTDTPTLIELFRNTVHTVCRRDYSPEQLAVWAPENIDVEKWGRRFSGSYTLIAENKNQILGFANLESDGNIDMFYVAAANQSKGVGTLLYEALEDEARNQGLKRLYSDVSLTARHFFKTKGFVIQKEYLKNIGKVNFPNAVMEKALLKAFGVDKNGFIITEVSLDKIIPFFKPIVDDVLNSIVREFTSQLDGVYLYGSIATGKAIEGKSDLDSILIFKDKPNPELLMAVSKLEKELSKRYEQVLRGIGLEFDSVESVCSEKEKYGGMCFLKHLCVCIYGNDLSKSVSAFKPSEKVAHGFNGDIEQRLEFWRAKFEKASNEMELKIMTQSLAKKIIRTGFSLVMPQSKSWTTDLQASSETFLRYYPEKAVEMNMALGWSISGLSDKQAILEFIDTFGKWLAEEFHRKFSAYY